MQTPGPAVADRVGQAEASESVDRHSQFVRSGAVTALVDRQVPASLGIRSQVELLAFIRSTETLPAEPAYERQALHVVWRLVAATSLAATTLALGALLTAVAFTGGSLRPNPFIALALLGVGATFVATLYAALRSA